MNFFFTKREGKKLQKKQTKKCFLSTVNAWLTAGAWPMTCHYLKKQNKQKKREVWRKGTSQDLCWGGGVLNLSWTYTANWRHFHWKRRLETLLLQKKCDIFFFLNKTVRKTTKQLNWNWARWYFTSSSHRPLILFLHGICTLWSMWMCDMRVWMWVCVYVWVCVGMCTRF